MKLSFHQKGAQIPNPVEAAVSLLKACGFDATKVEATIETGEFSRVILDLTWAPPQGSGVAVEDPTMVNAMIAAWAGKGKS